MKNVRNWSISLLTFLAILLLGLFACQKEQTATRTVQAGKEDVNGSIEARGCEYSIPGVYYNLVTVGSNNFNIVTDYAVKSDKSTKTAIRVVWKGNRLTKENSAGVISFIETTEADERAKLRSVLGLGTINIDSREAHHVIPAQHWQHRVVSIAGLGGFHPTHGFNGIPLSKVRDGGLHGNHPQYNTWVLNQLNAFANNNNISNVGNSRFICNIWIQCRLIPELIRRINEAAYNNSSVNEQFRAYNAQPFVYIGN